MIIRGKKAPILGRVCMDQLMVDVTDIEGVAVRDEVILFGPNDCLVSSSNNASTGEVAEMISVEEVAAPANSFNYELVCNVARRVERVYYRDGKVIDSVNYLSK